MKPRILTREILRDLIDYNPDTGVVTWKVRDTSYFNDTRQAKEYEAEKWNKRYAGKQAGTLQKRGYYSVCIFRRTYRLHRIIWLLVYGNFPQNVDHINGHPGDNRLVNLRDVSIQENGKNRKLNKNNVSGYCGVTLDKRVNKWRAQMKLNGKMLRFGYFDNLEDAVSARKLAEVTYGFHTNHGRFIEV